MIERLFVVLLALGLIYLVTHYAGAFFAQLIRLSRTNKPYSCLYLHKTVMLEIDCFKKIESEDALEHVKNCPKTTDAERNALRKLYLASRPVPLPPQSTPKKKHNHRWSSEQYYLNGAIVKICTKCLATRTTHFNKGGVVR